MCSVPENVLCALEKNVYSAFWGMKTSIKSNCYVVSFRISFPVISLYHLVSLLLIFCLEDLSFDMRKVLKSPTSIIFLSISSFMSYSFMYWGVPIIGCIYGAKCNILSCIDLYIII